MEARFRVGRSDTEESVYIKSVQSSSAIKALFSHCPEYMIRFVEQIVCAIDALVSTDAIPENSYIDSLMLSWYESRSREKRAAAKKERSRIGIERTVTEFSHIRTGYRYEDGRASLVIPSIRLGEKSDARPWITIYRYPDDTDPYSQRLRYYGDYFCITSHRTAIPLEAVISESAERIEPRVVISHGGRNLYDSESRLYRDFIAFGNDGRETLKRPDEEYVNVFIAACASLQGESTSPDCAASPCGGGLMYRILIDDKTFISVNESNVFPIEQVVSGLTLNRSVASVAHCRYLFGRQEYSIFTTQATLTITSEEKHAEKQYRLIIDGVPHSLAEYKDGSGNSFGIELPNGRGTHAFHIIEHATRHRIYTLSYVILEAFSLSFNGFYYYDNFPENGSFEVSDHNGSRHYPYEPLPDQPYMLIPYGEGDLSVDIPILFCRLDGEVLSVDNNRVFWYNDIAMSALLEVSVPSGYSCMAAIGQRMLPAEKVELGNEIRIHQGPAVEAVGLIICKKNEPPIRIKLFDIAFKPQFRSAPLLSESEGLFWRIENNFIGDKDGELTAVICHKGREIGRYGVGRSDEVIPLENPLEDGVYDYVVEQKAPGFFCRAQEIMRGRLIVGNAARFRFDDCAILVTEAIIDNARIKLKPASGIITGLQYVGERGLNGETLHYPCYRGNLQFKHEGGLRPYATREYERGGIYRERVNPIKLWYINDYTISLRSPSDDGLYVNKRWESITDRVPPERNASRASDENNYCNPDYYSFKIIDLPEVEDV
jgi:hypothetical protein